jgi:exonuclease III
VGSVNVTSLTDNWRFLEPLAADVWLLQETKTSTSICSTNMKQLGFHMLWGKEQGHGTTLVGIAVKDGRAGVLELPGLPFEWEERVVAALWTPAVGVSVVLVSVYGFTSPTAAQKTSLNHLLLWLLALSEEKGAVQWMIGGDLLVA